MTHEWDMRDGHAEHAGYLATASPGCQDVTTTPGRHDNVMTAPARHESATTTPERHESATTMPQRHDCATTTSERHDLDGVITVGS